jgi:hypothetical protein
MKKNTVKLCNNTWDNFGYHCNLELGMSRVLLIDLVSAYYSLRISATQNFIMYVNICRGVYTQLICLQKTVMQIIHSEQSGNRKEKSKIDSSHQYTNMKS